MPLLGDPDCLVGVCNALVHPQQEMVSEEWRLVVIAIKTGLRQGEQFSLRWDYVDLENGVLTLPMPKGGKTRHVPLSNGAMRFFVRSTASCRRRLFSRVFEDRTITWMLGCLNVAPMSRRSGRQALRGLLVYGAPDRTRTCNLLIRSQMLYPLSYGRVPKGSVEL